MTAPHFSAPCTLAAHFCTPRHGSSPFLCPEARRHHFLQHGAVRFCALQRSGIRFLCPKARQWPIFAPRAAALQVSHYRAAAHRLGTPGIEHIRNPFFKHPFPSGSRVWMNPIQIIGVYLELSYGLILHISIIITNQLNNPKTISVLEDFTFPCWWIHFRRCTKINW